METNSLVTFFSLFKLTSPNAIFISDSCSGFKKIGRFSEKTFPFFIKK